MKKIRLWERMIMKFCHTRWYLQKKEAHIELIWSFTKESKPTFNWQCDEWPSPFKKTEEPIWSFYPLFKRTFSNSFRVFTLTSGISWQPSSWMPVKLPLTKICLLTLEKDFVRKRDSIGFNLKHQRSSNQTKTNFFRTITCCNLCKSIG